MQLSFEILGELMLYSAIFGVVYYLLYRPFIYAVVDPLFIFVFTTAFSSVLVIETVEEPRNVIHFFVCQLCLWAGFALVQWRTGIPTRQLEPKPVPQFNDVDLLRYTVYALLGIYFLSTFIFLQSKGFALLSDAPSDNKVANFQNGFGIFRKINWAVGGVAGAGLMFLYLNKSRRHYLVLLLILMGFTALEGSKGALVRYAVSLGLLLFHPAFLNKRDLLKGVQKFLPIGLAGIFVVFFAVLFKENDSPEEVLLAFIRRLLYGADALLFFYHPNNVDYFAHYSIWDFPNYLLNPILGFLRIAPYEEAFGNIMVQNTLPPGIFPDVIIGPNSSFYTEGQVFFGYYGAFVYSFLLGCLASYIRSSYFSLLRSSAFFLVFASTMYQFSVSLLIDVKIFITQGFDTLLLVLPVYILVCLAVRGRIVLRRIGFLLPTKQLPQSL